MPRPTTDWYLVVIVAVIVAAAGGAVFYLSAFTAVDAEWFKGIGLTGFGALLGLLVPKSIGPPS